MPTMLLTVMSFLLTAAAALISIDYGGQALAAAVNKGQAVSSVSAVSQVAQAVAVHDMQEPKQFTGSNLAPLVQDRYLKAIPRNPTGGAPITVDDAGQGHVLVAMQVGGKPAVADKVCSTVRKEIAKKVVLPKSEDVQLAAAPVGCVKVDGQDVVFAQG